MEYSEEYIEQNRDQWTPCLKSWLIQDPCLKALALFIRYVADTAEERLDQLLAHLEHHDGAFMRCIFQTIAFADWCEDGLRRAVYEYFCRVAMESFVEMSGCRRDHEVTSEGVHFRTQFSDELQAEQRLPFRTIERFFPKLVTGSRKRTWTFEVGAEEELEARRPIQQTIDKMATRQVKAFSSGGRHWRPIVSEPGNEESLVIRWQGQERRIEPDWKLYPRYKRLLWKHAQKGPDRDPSDDQVLIEQAATKYNERSWFAGYLATFARMRRIDAYRKAERQRRNEVRLVEQSRRAAESEGQTREKSTEIDYPHRLLASLSERDHKILTLKAQGLTDEAIGRYVGLSRVWVNRIRAQIKRKAGILRDAE